MTGRTHGGTGRRPLWSAGARSVGLAGAAATAVLGIFYILVIGAWVVVEGTPRAPIGDPYLAAMELLTILSAGALIGLFLAVAAAVERTHRLLGLTAFGLGLIASATTITVHVIQLTAVRQLWAAGALPDYRLVWPSVIFAAEYTAWDLFLGSAMLLAAKAMQGVPDSGAARVALAVSGGLCVIGLIGPLTGHMVLQNVALVGYAVVLPVAAAIMTRTFYRLDPSGVV